MLCHLPCAATCLLRADKQLYYVTDEQVGDGIAFHASNKTFELRKLIKMIIACGLLVSNVFSRLET